MNGSQLRRRAVRWSMALLLILLTATAIPAASAQGDARYFGETSHYLRGAFRYFWESHGGLANFGFPITEEYIRKSDGRIVQYFERARFELAGVVNNQAVIELAWLGMETTGNKIFPRVPPQRSTAAIRYFGETQHTLRGLFKTTWETRGAQNIFGLPISEEIYEPLADGSWHLVQYFQKSRFELWPGGVRLGLLGRELAPPQLLAPWPPEVVPPGPLSEEGVPGPPAAPPSGGANRRAFVRVTPPAGDRGDTFQIFGEGFQAGERVIMWVTYPDQAIRPLGNVPAADGNGSISGADIYVTLDKRERISPDGYYYVTAQGLSTGRIGIGVFAIGIEPPPPAPAPGPPSDPNRLGIVIHQSLVPRGSGSITPLAAAPGGAFTFTASGFDPNERVGVWLTRPNGAGQEDVAASQIGQDGRGNITVSFRPAVQSEGIWTISAQGVRTGRNVAAPFKVTRDYVAPLGTPRPASRNGSVNPAEGGRRTVFALSGTGFQANEPLELWITSPDGLYILTSARADGRGRVGYSPGLLVQFGAQNPTGVYGYHYRGTRSDRRVDLYFTYNGR
jgi:hypothetical protein